MIMAIAEHGLINTENVKSVRGKTFEVIAPRSIVRQPNSKLAKVRLAAPHKPSALRYRSVVFFIECTTGVVLINLVVADSVDDSLNR